MVEGNNNKSNASLNSGEAKDTFFHEFFFPNSSPAATRTACGDRSPAISAVSEQGSEKQVLNHLEGVPFYSPGSGSGLTWSEMSNRSARNKRSISDSVFMDSSRDGFQHIRPESSEGLHLMKVLRNARAERARPTSTPHLLGLPSGKRTDPSGPRWDRAMPLHFGPTLQHASPPVHTPFSMHMSVSRYKNGCAGPSGLSQLAADEGSRTGMKESGILSSIIGGTGAPSGVILTGNKTNFQRPKSEPDCSTSASRHGSAPGNRQMTIFYDGQAHVFDDVHPNKAEVIMEVAGSNGGSWSTSFGKSGTPITSNNLKSNEVGMANKHVIPGQLGRNLSITGTTAHGFGSSYEILEPLGPDETI